MGRRYHHQGAGFPGVEVLEGRSLLSVMVWDSVPGDVAGDVWEHVAVTEREHSAGDDSHKTPGAGGEERGAASGPDFQGNSHVQDPPAIAPTELRVNFRSLTERTRVPLSAGVASEHVENGSGGSTEPTGVNTVDLVSENAVGGDVSFSDRAAPALTLTGWSGGAQVAYPPLARSPGLAVGSARSVALAVRASVDPRTGLPTAAYDAGAPPLAEGPSEPISPEPTQGESWRVSTPLEELDDDETSEAPGQATLLEGASPFDWSKLEQDLRQFLGLSDDSEAGSSLHERGAGWPLGLAAVVASIAVREASRRRARRLAGWGAVASGRSLAPTGPWPLGPL